MESLQNIWDIATACIEGAALLVAGAAIIAAATPTPRDDALLAKARKFIDVMALNVANAKNKGSKP